MITRIYQLYSTAIQANAASVQIRKRGRIVAVSFSGFLNSATDDTGLRIELSFSSTSQLTTNDAYGVIAHAEIAYLNILTSGFADMAKNHFVHSLAVDVDIGNILYINTASTGAPSGAFWCLVHVVE